jgi:hypothetical protein
LKGKEKKDISIHGNDRPQDEFQPKRRNIPPIETVAFALVLRTRHVLVEAYGDGETIDVPTTARADGFIPWLGGEAG